MPGAREDPDPTDPVGQPAGPAGPGDPAGPVGEQPAAVGRTTARRWAVAVGAVCAVLAAAIVLTVGGWLGPPDRGHDADRGGPDGGAARAGDGNSPREGAGSGSSGAPAGATTNGPGGPGGSGGSGGSGGGAAGPPRATGDAGGGTNQGGGVPPVLPPDLFPQLPGTGPGGGGDSGGPAGGGTTFTAVAGPGCPRAADHGVDEVGGWERGAGGWQQDGCDGTHLARRTTAAGADTVTWRFEVPSAGACAVEVYVPEGVDAPDAFYNVVSGGTVDGFTVDQAGNPGRWVPGGTFRAAKGRLRVRLTDRGDGRTRVAAAALRVTCH